MSVLEALQYLAKKKAVDKAARFMGFEKRALDDDQLQRGYDTDTLPMDQLEAVSNERINTNLKLKGTK